MPDWGEAVDPSGLSPEQPVVLLHEKETGAHPGDYQKHANMFHGREMKFRYFVFKFIGVLWRQAQKCPSVRPFIIFLVKIRVPLWPHSRLPPWYYGYVRRQQVGSCCSTLSRRQGEKGCS